MLVVAGRNSVPQSRGILSNFFGHRLCTRVDNSISHADLFARGIRIRIGRREPAAAVLILIEQVFGEHAKHKGRVLHVGAVATLWTPDVAVRQHSHRFRLGGGPAHQHYVLVLEHLRHQCNGSGAQNPAVLQLQWV